MEINFEKRYTPIYMLILAVTNYITTKVNFTFGNVVISVISIDAIVLIITLIFLSLFTRKQKERVALGIFYKKRPFEKVAKYVKHEDRINVLSIKNKNLENMSNFEFYNTYYKLVCNNPSVKNKNEEFCIMGGGDMFYIDYDSNSIIVIDCYLENDYDKRRIIDEIISKFGSRKIKGFISTHPDEDHIMGLKHYREKFGITNFYCVKNNTTKKFATGDFKEYCDLRDSTYQLDLYKDHHIIPSIDILWPDTDNSYFK